MAGISILSVFKNSSAIAAQEPIVRVMLIEASQLRLRSDGSKTFYVGGIKTGKKKIKGMKMLFKNGKAVFAIDSKPGIWNSLSPGFEFRIKSNDPRGIWLGKRRYGGELRVFMSGKKFKVINHVKVEKYLKSVVGSEMLKTWPMPALKAQAVAARTYALQQLGKREIYDINSTVSSQVYLGVEAETPRTKQAVNTTRSLVILFNGKLIDAVFHSSSGGQTENSGSVWKYQRQYLISVPDYDQNSPKYKWKVIFTASELKKIFPEINGLNTIQVIDTSKTGRILKAKLHGSGGKLILTGKELRSRLNLNSTLATFSMELNYLENVNSKEKATLKNNYLNNDIYHKNLKKRNLNYGIKRLPELPLIIDNYSLIVKGYGAGHGVGMSQWGAFSMAKKGYSYSDIIKHYYRGAYIRNYRSR